MSFDSIWNYVNSATTASSVTNAVGYITLGNDGQIKFGGSYTSDLNSIDDTQTLVLIQKDIDNDLTTRWLNGARGRLNDPTYSLAIPIGQNQQPLEQIFDFWFKLYTKSKVVILAPQITDGLGAWSDRIEFRYLDCSV